MLPRSDLDFWNRRENATTIRVNLRWTWRHIWAHARIAALCLIGVHILLGIQPALLIHVTRNLVDTVVDLADGGTSGFGDILPWLIAFGVILLLTREVLWNVRDVLHLRLEQNLSHIMGRRLLERSARLPLLFFDVSETYDRLERGPGSRAEAGSAVLHDLARFRGRDQGCLRGRHVRPGFAVDYPRPAGCTGAADPSGDGAEPDVYGFHLRRNAGGTAGRLRRPNPDRADRAERDASLRPSCAAHRTLALDATCAEGTAVEPASAPGHRRPARHRAARRRGPRRGRRPRVPARRPGTHTRTIRGAISGCGRHAGRRRQSRPQFPGTARSFRRKSVT